MSTDKKHAHCPITASNYVCTADIRTTADIHVLTHLLHGQSSYTVFPAARIRIRNPRIAFQIFKSGRIVASGAATEWEAIQALHDLLAYIRKYLRVELHAYNFRVENIVAFGSIGFPFNQSLFYEDHQMVLPAVKKEETKSQSVPLVDAKKTKKRKRNMEGLSYAEFNPGQFRGLQFYPDFPAVAVMFQSGKYVVTGSASEEKIANYMSSVDWPKYEEGKEYRPFDAKKGKLREVDIQRGKKKKRKLDIQSSSSSSPPTRKSPQNIFTMCMAALRRIHGVVTPGLQKQGFLD